MSKRRRFEVRWTAEFEAKVHLLLPGCEDQLNGFETTVSRNPAEMGMAVAGESQAFGRPLHTDRGSFLIIYLFDGQTVLFVGIKSIPSGIY